MKRAAGWYRVREGAHWFCVEVDKNGWVFIGGEKYGHKEFHEWGDRIEFPAVPKNYSRILEHPFLPVKP